MYACPKCKGKNLLVEGKVVAALFQDDQGKISIDGRSEFYWDDEAHTVCDDCEHEGAAMWFFDADTGCEVSQS